MKTDAGISRRLGFYSNGGVDVQVTTMFSRGCGKAAGVALTVSALALALPGTARGQSADDPNPGAITFTGGFDVLPGSAYVFRGITQESDPKITMWPYGDIGIALQSGDGAIKSTSLNFGVWNSLHTGSAGLDGPSGQLHYELDFYATLGLGFSRGFALGTTYTSYTSPNSMFGTVKEIALKLSKTHMLNPYGLVAMELGGDAAPAADGGNPGTYLELGVGPTFPLMESGLAVTVPFKLGMSLKDYYEGFDGDQKFGFVDIGALLTMPIKGIPPSYGAWNFHAGADLFFFGKTTEALNSGDNMKVTGLFGIGVSY